VKTVFVHSPYLVHLASPRASVRTKSWKKLKEDLSLASDLGIDGYVAHLDMQHPEQELVFLEEYSRYLSMISSNIHFSWKTLQRQSLLARILIRFGCSSSGLYLISRRRLSRYCTFGCSWFDILQILETSDFMS